MSELMKIAGEKAHERSMNFSTYPVDDMNIIVEGTLIDKRLSDYYLASGEKKPAGVIHHMVIKMLIDITEMAISEIEVEMHVCPREWCTEIIDSMQLIKGVKITSGFSARIRDLIGGVKGCTHLVTLLTAMGPAALQGLWSYKAQKPYGKGSTEFDKKRIRMMLKRIKNTCYMWREDGPGYGELKESIDKLLSE